MTRTSTVLIAAVAACSSVALAQQSPATQRSYQVREFDSISAAGPNNVIVTVGGDTSVRAQGPADILDKMEVVVKDGDLEIRPRREYRNNFQWDGRRRATFYVTAPMVKAAAIAGSGDMKIDRVHGDRFSGAVAGSGNLDVASLSVAKGDFSIAGSGDLSARGSAAESKLAIAGSGNLKLGQLSTRRTSVSIAGSGGAEVNASETANVSVMGSGRAHVGGTARCSVSKMGTGSIRCGR